jgi:hypothetical protein
MTATNRDLLKEILGRAPISMIQELYYYDGKLDEESMGTLQITFENGDAYTFNCHQDTESLSIKKMGFTDKSSFAGTEWSWQEKEFIPKEQLLKNGEISEIKLARILAYETDFIEVACILEFREGAFLSIWTAHADNIFYDFNVYPPDYRVCEIETLK